MPVGTNPARRVAAALDLAMAYPAEQNTTAMDVWAAAFRVTLDAGDYRRPVVIGWQLIQLADQLKVAEASMRSDHPRVQASRYVPQFEHLAHAFNPRLLYDRWLGSSSQYLGDVYVHALGFVADMLDDDAMEVPREALDNLLDLVSDLEDDVSGGDGLDHGLRRFILRALAGVRAAVREYPVSGAEALKNAYQILVYGLAEYAPAVKARERSPIVAKLVVVAGAVMTIVNNSGEFVDNLDHLRIAGTAVHAVAAQAAKQLRLPPPAVKLLPAGDPAPVDATATHPLPDLPGVRP